MSSDLLVFLLCAGKGSRIATMTNGAPKPLFPVYGISPLQRTLTWLLSYNLTQVHMNLHQQPHLFVETTTRLFPQCHFHYIYEPVLLGTAGALHSIAKEWTSSVLVIYGDNIVNFDLTKFYLFHTEKKGIASIAVFHQETHIHTGIAGSSLEIREEKVCQFTELPPTKNTYVNAGVYLLEPPVLQYISSQPPTDFGKDVFPRMLSQGEKIFAHTLDGYCLGVDTPLSHHTAETLLANL